MYTQQQRDEEDGESQAHDHVGRTYNVPRARGGRGPVQLNTKSACYTRQVQESSDNTKK